MHQMWQHQCPPCGAQTFPYFPPEPEPYVRKTATNGDHDATTEPQTTATTAPEADENDNGQDDEHEYVITETDNNIE